MGQSSGAHLIYLYLIRQLKNLELSLNDCHFNQIKNWILISGIYNLNCLKKTLNNIGLDEKYLELVTDYNIDNYCPLKKINQINFSQINNINLYKNSNVILIHGCLDKSVSFSQSNDFFFFLIVLKKLKF